MLSSWVTIILNKAVTIVTYALWSALAKIEQVSSTNVESTKVSQQRGFNRREWCTNLISMQLNAGFD